MRASGLNTIFLVAPTSSRERMKAIAEASNGFLYAVSRTGVTGERQELADDLRDFLRTLRSFTKSPIAVGFGISRPEHLQAVWQEADGAVVGSSIVKKVEAYIGNPELVSEVGEFARWLRGHDPSLKKMTIEDWRHKIDEIDRKLVELLNERSKCAIEIGKIKKAENLGVHDADREREILRRIKEANTGPLDGDGLQRLFKRIIDECRQLEHFEQEGKKD
jgi:chorismate mutase-like protein